MQKRITIALLALCLTLPALAQNKINLTVATPGQPNLAAGDFSVNVNGKAATVSPAPDFKVPVAAKADDLTSEPAETVTSPIIFVFDVMETRALDERDLRKIVLRYMADAATHKQAVGLVVMKADGIKVVHDYRVGSAVLAAAMAAVNGQTPVPVPGAERVVAEETRRLVDFAKGLDANPTPQNQLLHVNIDTPIVMMDDIAAAMKGVPGRKAIVWVTNGVPFEILDNDHSVTSHQENNLGAAVNGERVGGLKRILSDSEIKKLQPEWQMALNDLAQSGTGVYAVEARGASGVAGGILFTSTMDSLAHMTGGRAAYGTNDPAPFFGSIANENAVTNALTVNYEPVKTEWQKLAVSSPKSAKVLAPIGFFPTPSTPADEARKRAVTQALNSPMSFVALPFELKLGEQTANGAKKTVKFSVFLPPDSAIADAKAGEVNIDVVAAALNPNGSHAGFMSTGAGGKLPPEAIQQISQNGVNLGKSIDVPPGQYTLRVVVRDNLTGRIGTVNADLKVQ